MSHESPRHAKRLRVVPYIAIAWLAMVLALNMASMGAAVSLQYQGF
jgi:hypothetical protein